MIAKLRRLSFEHVVPILSGVSRFSWLAWLRYSLGLTVLMVPIVLFSHVEFIFIYCAIALIALVNKLWSFGLGVVLLFAGAIMLSVNRHAGAESYISCAYGFLWIGIVSGFFEMLKCLLDRIFANDLTTWCGCGGQGESILDLSP